jgi:hypothetical protein
LPAALPRRRLLVPPDTDAARTAELRATGWITVAALMPTPDWHGEAARLNCSHVLERNTPVAVRGGRG